MRKHGWFIVGMVFLSGAGICVDVGYIGVAVSSLASAAICMIYGAHT